MDNTYWHKQNLDQPLFGDSIWNKPEQRTLAGKLAVFGGNAHGFNNVFKAAVTAQQAGIGTLRTIVPSALKPTLSKLWPEAEYAPSTVSGGFATKALDIWLEAADWSNGVLIAGDLGKNSETDILLEHFISKYTGLLTLAGDSLYFIQNTPQAVMANAAILLAAELPSLQHLLTAIRFPTAVRSDMPLVMLIELLHSLTQSYPVSLLTCQDKQIILAVNGQVSTTPSKNIELKQAAAAATVWRLQQPNTAFAAMTSALFTLSQRQP